jgi:hypothetical protein
MNSSIIKRRSVYISSKLLKDKYEISNSRINSLKELKNNIGYEKEGSFYVCYDALPDTILKQIPNRKYFISLAKKEFFEMDAECIYDRLKYAQDNYFRQNIIFYKGLFPNNPADYAKHQAVWDELVSIHTTCKSASLKDIWTAYNRIYPDRFCYKRMNRCINQCKETGTPSLLIHQYKGRKREFDDVYLYWVSEILKSGKRYAPTKVYDIISQLSKENKRKVPCFSTVKQWIKRLRPIANQSRMGDEYNYNKLPYVSMERASKSNIQWQIDGWDLPFYMEGYKRLTLFTVIDSHSGKIIGYHLSESESTETIMKGLEHAVENTGVVPLEIVSDNHSFNKTSEADYFKSALKNMGGTIWTVSSNPRRKSFIERSFRTFGEQFCKDKPGYIGSGITTKNDYGRTSQELLDKYQRSGYWLTRDQIIMIAVKCVDEFNNAIGKDGLSRNDRYDKNISTETVKVNLIDRLKLFERTAQYKVSRGQINILRSGVKYEFQLSAKYFNQLNDKIVNVRYIDYDELYLFDEKDQFITTVRKKEIIHSAIADQTERDKELLYRNKGRLNGIKTANKKALNSLGDNAYDIDKNAAYSINPKLNDKDLIKDFKRRGDLIRQLERFDVNPETVSQFPKVKEVNCYDPEEELRKKKHISPFLATEKEKREFNLNEELNKE